MPNASKTFFTKAILLRYLGNWKRRLCAYLRWINWPTWVTRRACVRCDLCEPANRYKSGSGLASSSDQPVQPSDEKHECYRESTDCNSSG